MTTRVRKRFRRRARSEMPKWGRRTLIEKDLHLRRRQRTLRGMLQNSANLFRRDALKPVSEVMNGGAAFQVLEHDRDRHPRASEDPCSAYALGVAFNFGAARPVNHCKIVAPRVDAARFCWRQQVLSWWATKRWELLRRWTVRANVEAERPKPAGRAELKTYRQRSAASWRRSTRATG